MSQEACPLPTRPTDQEEATIKRMLAAKRIAVVGISTDPARAGHYVPQYLQEHGYEILPINPKYPQVLGRPSLPSLADLPAPPDVVQVFRRSEYAAEVTTQAIDAGAKGVWLQQGIRSDEARALAKRAGIDFIQDRCMMVEHRRHAGK